MNDSSMMIILNNHSKEVNNMPNNTGVQATQKQQTVSELIAEKTFFYGPVGNHLGEFFADPYLHLKIPEEELREKVLNTRPELMDRSGDKATPGQYWQWYTELNRITVNDFEAELRAMNFEPWRVAVRNNSMVEYTAELQNYSFTNLATSELYLSVINRK